MSEVLRAVWAGLTLRCPFCGQGRMSRGLLSISRQCPHCGVVFEREEGDFVGAMVIAYSITAVLVVVGIFVVERVADLSLSQHAWIWSLFTGLFLILTYRNMKGVWVSILYLMVGLKREED